jgi:hypothetical protein
MDLTFCDNEIDIETNSKLNCSFNQPSKHLKKENFQIKT